MGYGGSRYSRRASDECDQSTGDNSAASIQGGQTMRPLSSLELAILAVVLLIWFLGPIISRLVDLLFSPLDRLDQRVLNWQRRYLNRWERLRKKRWDAN
jgi:hypothetical protein